MGRILVDALGLPIHYNDGMKNGGQTYLNTQLVRVLLCDAAERGTPLPSRHICTLAQATCLVFALSGWRLLLLPTLDAGEDLAVVQTPPKPAALVIDPAMPALLEAIDADDVPRLETLLKARPDLLEKPCRDNYVIKPAEYAMRENKVKVARYLLERGARVQDCERPGDSLLYHLMKGANLPMVRLLIDYGADVNLRSWNGETALYAAIRYQVDEYVDVLLLNGADVNAADISRRTPLDIAVESGRLDYVNHLLALGARVEGGYRDWLEPRTHYLWASTEPKARYGYMYGTRPIMYTALLGSSVDIVRALGIRGIEWPPVLTDRFNAWHFAALSPCANEMFPLLVHLPYDINSKNENGATPLWVYCTANQYSYRQRGYARNRADTFGAGFHFLIAHGADLHVNAIKGWTILHQLAFGNDPEVIRFCVASGLDVNAKTARSETPLDLAIASHWNSVVIPELLAQGAKVRANYAIGSTALTQLIGINRYRAVNDSFSQIDLSDTFDAPIRALVRHGCDPNETDKNGHTPLGLACETYNLEAMRALLDCGAKSNLISYGLTPLEIAVRNNHFAGVDLLLLHGANPRAPDSNGQELLPSLLERRRDNWIFRILRSLDVQSDSDAPIIVLIYSAQQTPVNLGLLAIFSLAVLSAGLWIRRWISVHGAGLTGAGAEATLDEISARADWKELLAKFEEAQAFQRRVFLHRPWILIGAFGWVFGVGFLWYDPILNLLVQPQAWWYVALFSLAFLVSCGLQFTRASGWRIFGASLGIVALVVGGFFASAAVYVLFAYPLLYLPGGVLALAILATLTAAWRFHRTLKAEMALRRIQLPPGFEFHRKATADGAEIKPPAGWDEGRG